MAVSHVVSSQSHASGAESVSQASFSWTHTTTTNPRGVLVLVFQAVSSGAAAISVTYDGTDVPAVSGGRAVDTATEPGSVQAFFLGSGVPTTDNPTVVVNRVNNTTAMWAVCATQTADGDTEAVGVVLTENNGTITQQSVDDGSPGSNSVRYAGVFYGGATPAPAGADSTLLHSNDQGANGWTAVRETTPGQGSRLVGCTQATSDDRAGVHLAVREVASITGDATATPATVSGAGTVSTGGGMAFTVTARHSGNSGTTSAQTRATNSTTPTANSLFLVCWSSQNNASATAPSFQTPTGGGLTYTQVRTAGDATSYPWNGDDSFRVASAVYRATVGGSPSAFTVTVDSSSGTATFYYGVVCLDITGYDTSAPIVGTPGIAGGTKSTGDTETGTVTLGATPTAGNLIIVVLGAGADNGGGFASPTAGAGKTFQTVTNQTTAFCQTGVFYRIADGTESTTITCSDLGQTVGNYSAIAVEIKAEAGAAITGAGAAVAPVPTVAGTGNVGDPEITGNGDAVAPAASVAGTGDVVVLFITSIAGSGNQQYPADQNSDPILIRGDVIWAFPGNAGRWGGTWQSDITDYLDIRQAQGFNLLMIGALGSTQNGTISDTGETFDGVLPFSGGNGVLNDTYWTRVDYIVDEAAARGITVLLNVAYSYDMDTASLSGFSNANYTTYGTNLGNRYKTKTNLIWGAGGDYFDTQVTQLGNLFTAVQATGDTHLISIQNYPESTSRKDIFNNGTNTTGVNWSDWNFVYSYNVTYDGVEYAYDETSPVCVIWGDGHFDQDSSPDRKVMRDLVWWALSSGARGHIYGSEGTWAWASGALANAASETVPSTDLANYWETFTGFTNWHQLVPDTDSSFVTAGRGTHAAALSSGGGGGEYNSSDTQDAYVTASITPDGTLAVVYFPVDQTITVDDTELGAGYTATWVDPTNGATSSATIAGTYSPTGNNALGGPDWLLVFESSAAAEITGSGAVTAPTQTVSGAGTVEVTGTGGSVAPATAVAGAGGAIATGTGSATAPAATASGTASVTIAGTGEAVAPSAVASGTGTIGAVPVTGDGELVAPLAVAAGSAAVLVEGSGSASAAAAAASGTGGPLASGTGSATAPAATVAGSGNIGAAPITGDGSLIAPVSASAGAGTVEVTGTGDISAPSAVTSGAGNLGAGPITGNGDLVAASSTAAGDGTVLVDGNGSIVTPTVIITGTGAVVITGTGSAVAPTAVAAGSMSAAITLRPNIGTTTRPFTGVTDRP